MTQSINSKFQFTTPKITNFSYKANKDSVEGEFKLQIAHRKHIVRTSLNTATVSLDMKIDFVGDDSPFLIFSSFVSEFTWEDSTEELISDFLNFNAPSLLIGYARPIIAMFTNSSGFTPLNIPMIDLTNDPVIDTSYNE